MAIAFLQRVESTDDSSIVEVLSDGPTILLPSAVVGVLFMVAAFRNYAVQQPIGFVRSLIPVGVCLILGLVIASSLNMTLRLDDKFNINNPLDWLPLIAGLTPISAYFVVVIRKELAILKSRN